MAAVVKETSVLRVVLNDEAGGEKNFNIDDYQVGVTLAQVTSAFAQFFGENAITPDPLLQTSTGLKLTSVARAETVDTRTTINYLA